MTRSEFEEQFQRLIKTYGQKDFPPERIKLVWEETNFLVHDRFRKMVDYFIGEFKYAPLLKDFREYVVKLREEIWAKTKEQEAKNAKDFWQGTYHPDEIKHIGTTIRKRIMHQMPDSDWSQFMEGLKNSVGPKA